MFFSFLFQFPDLAGQGLQIRLEVGIVLLDICRNLAEIEGGRGDEISNRTLGSERGWL